MQVIKKPLPYRSNFPSSGDGILANSRTEEATAAANYQSLGGRRRRGCRRHGEAASCSWCFDARAQEGTLEVMNQSRRTLASRTDRVTQVIKSNLSVKYANRKIKVQRESHEIMTWRKNPSISGQARQAGPLGPPTL